MKDMEVNELKTKAKKDLEHTKKYYQKKNVKLPEISGVSQADKSSNQKGEVSAQSTTNVRSSLAKPSLTHKGASPIKDSKIEIDKSDIKATSWVDIDKM